MTQADQTKIFRKEALDRIASPEQLTDYLRIPRAGAWIVLAVCLLLLIVLLAYASIGTLDTGIPVKVLVEDGTAQIVPLENGRLEAGMPLRVNGREYRISKVTEDDFGRPVASAELPLENGSYDAVVITEHIRPLFFLFG